MPTGLPFARGESLNASADVVSLLGQDFFIDDELYQGTICLRMVKNTTGTALAPFEVVRYEDRDKFEVTFSTAAIGNLEVAGVVDNAYATDSNFFPGSANVPDGEYFWMVQQGLAKYKTAATTTAFNTASAGDFVIMASEDGRGTGIGAESATTTYLALMKAKFARQVDDETSVDVNSLAYIDVEF